MPNKLSRVLLVLVCAQFIITIDTTFMNVSLSTLVTDLHTTVTGVQGAITLYALVMAAFMIAGAKFGDIIGRKKAFITGLLIYAAGTTITSLSGNLTVFILGWSVLEGIGAAIMLPAMMSLIADNFAAGPARTKAYAMFAGTAGVAAALGPIVGGLFTTYLSWRLAFASELLVAIYIISQRHLIREQTLPGPTPKFDWLGFVLSASGLVIVVQGIILASAYGVIKARVPYTVAGHTLLQAGGTSPTVLFVLCGLVILAVFLFVESRRLAMGKHTLLNVTLLKLPTIKYGSSTLLMQMLLLNGVIFALSLYVQMELGYSAILSGLTLLPLSFGVLIFSVVAGRLLSKRFSPKGIMLTGFSLILLGVVAMGLTARNATSGFDFAIGLAFIGAGVGFVVSQNQNLMISSVSAKLTNETAGVANTFQNIGASLGTSLSGAIILAVFVSVATGLVASSPAFSPSERTKLDNAITTKAQIVSNQQLTAATAHLPADQQASILQINQQARQRALTVVYFALGFIGLIGILTVTRLPKTAPLIQAQEVTDAEPKTVKGGRKTASARGVA
jgi:MFS family permease